MKIAHSPVNSPHPIDSGLYLYCSHVYLLFMTKSSTAAENDISSPFPEPALNDSTERPTELTPKSRRSPVEGPGTGCSLSISEKRVPDRNIRE
jgi:hypothetical protein